MNVAKKLSSVLIVLAFLSVVFSQVNGQLPQILNYDLDLKIDYNTHKMLGKCELTILNATNEDIEKVPILLYRLLTVNAVKDDNNNPLAFDSKIVSISDWEQIQVNYMEIFIDKPLPPGEEKKIRMDYEGYLFGYSAEGWRYVRDHIARDFTIIRTDGFGYPIIGYPSESEMWHVLQENFDYKINVTVPAELIVLTGGKLIDKSRTGDKVTYTYYNKKPAWRMDIAIADYRILQNGENKVGYFTSDSLGARRVMDALQTSFELYTGWFCPLDNYQGFSIIEVPEGYGSQQDIVAIMLTADNFRGANDMRVIYHEVAHMWNVKNLEPQPCRFESEGYAQFLQFLLLERLDNKKDAVSEAATGFINRIQNTFSKNKDYQAIPIKDYGIKGMTDYSYTLGMVVFALFHNKIGQENFNKIIGSYYLAHHAEGATVDDFIEHCKKASPVDLDGFFNDWFYTTNGIQLIVEGKTFEELKDYYK